MDPDDDPDDGSEPPDDDSDLEDFDGADDCIHCEGEGCTECDWTGEYL